MTVKQKSTSATAVGLRKRRSPDVAIRLINETLRGPVVDIFVENIPGLKGLNRERAYELIMGSPELADCCFKLFRKKPELFDKLLLGPDSKATSGDDDVLRCGRSMSQVVALVVRAIAKRHFRAKLAPRRVMPKPVIQPSLWKRFLRLFSAPAPAPRKKRKATRADSLYQALHEHLLYEWQVSLIPHYVPLPVPLVRQLGVRILEFREPAQLRELALEGLPKTPIALGEAAAPASVPAAVPDSPVMASVAAVPVAAAPRRPQAGTAAVPPISGVPNASPSSKSEVMWKLSQTMDLPILFGIDEGAMRAIVAHISAVSGLAMSALNASGLRLR